MIQKIPIAEFIEKSKSNTFFDVRTPAEFYKGHIPGAVNLPLFTDEERVTVGTLYNKKGREAAILEGLDFVGPRMRKLVETVQHSTSSKTVLIHCWRGGMRSGSVAWLINYFGYSVFTLEGGYKSFRNFVIDELQKKRRFIIIGGRTGSGKTLLLDRLKQSGCQVIDLENLARHKGSAFGSIGMGSQPRQEHFENMLGMALFQADPDKPIILEDESRKIGGLQLPNSVYDQIRSSPLICIEVEKSERIQNLLDDYKTENKTELIQSVIKVRENLGGQLTQQALEHLENDRLGLCAEILLEYYDKTYDYGVSLRKPETVTKIQYSAEDESISEIVRLIQFLQKL